MADDGKGIVCTSCKENVMRRNKFDQEFDKALAMSEVKKPPTPALVVLNTVVEHINRRWSKNGMIARIDAGHETTYGQQWNVVITAKKVNYTDILFRAYIPSYEFPMHFDFVGEELTECYDVKDVERELLKFFKQSSVTTILSRIRYFSKGQ
jgi:hypothetical protein